MKAKRGGCSTGLSTVVCGTVDELVKYFKSHGQDFKTLRDVIKYKNNFVVSELSDEYDTELYDKVVKRAWFASKTGYDASLVLEDVQSEDRKYTSSSYMEIKVKSMRDKITIKNDVKRAIREIFERENREMDQKNIDRILDNNIQHYKLSLINRILPTIGIDTKYTSIHKFIRSEDYLKLKRIWCYDFENASENDFDAYDDNTTFATRDSAQARMDIAELFCFDDLLKDVNASFIKSKASNDSMISAEYSVKGKSLFKSNHFDDDKNQFTKEMNKMYDFFLSSLQYKPIYSSYLRNGEYGSGNSGMVYSESTVSKPMSSTSLIAAWIDFSKAAQYHKTSTLRSGYLNRDLTYGEAFTIMTTTTYDNFKNLFLEIISDERIRHDVKNDSRGILKALYDYMSDDAVNVSFGAYDLKHEIVRLLRECDPLPLLQKNLDRRGTRRGAVEQMSKFQFTGLYNISKQLSNNYGRLKDVNHIGCDANVYCTWTEGGKLIDSVVVEKDNWSVYLDMKPDSYNYTQFKMSIKIGDKLYSDSDIIAAIASGRSKIERGGSTQTDNGLYVDNRDAVTDIETELNKILSYAFGIDKSKLGTFASGYTDYQQSMGYKGPLDVRMHKLALAGLGAWFLSTEKLKDVTKPSRITITAINNLGYGYSLDVNPNSVMKISALPGVTSAGGMTLSGIAQNIYEANLSSDRRLSPTVRSNSGKMLDECHIHSAGTSVFKIWENFKKTGKSPARYNFLFKHDIFGMVKKLSEITVNGKSTDVKKLSKSDMFHLFYVDGHIDQRYSQSCLDGAPLDGTGYCVPLTISDKNFILTMTYDPELLGILCCKRREKGMTEIIERLMSGKLEKGETYESLMEELLRKDDEINLAYDRSVDYVQLQNVSSEDFMAMRYFENAAYLYLQKKAVDEDFRIMSLYSEIPEAELRRYNFEKLSAVAGEVNRDPLLKRKYRDVYTECEASGDFTKLKTLVKDFNLYEEPQSDSDIKNPDEFDKWIISDDCYSTKKGGEYGTEDVIFRKYGHIEEIDVISGMHVSKNHVFEKMLELYGIGGHIMDEYKVLFDQYEKDSDIAPIKDFANRYRLPNLIDSQNVPVDPNIFENGRLYDFMEYDKMNQIVSISNLMNFGVSLNKTNLAGYLAKKYTSNSTKKALTACWDKFYEAGNNHEWVSGDDVVLFKIPLESSNGKVEYMNITNRNQLSYLRITDEHYLEGIEKGLYSSANFKEVQDGEVTRLYYDRYPVPTSVVSYGKQWNLSEFESYLKLVGRTPIKHDASGMPMFIINPVMEELRQKQSMLADAFRNATTGQSYQFDKGESTAIVPLIGLSIGNERALADRTNAIPELDIMLLLEGCENTEQKRMTMDSAPEHLYMPSKYGIPVRGDVPYINQAIVDDNKSFAYLTYGTKFDITTDNGVVYVNPIFNCMLDVSSGMDGSDNVSSKPYVAAFFEKYGNSYPDKCAFMALSNTSIANSPEHERMFRRMSSVSFSDTLDKLIADGHVEPENGTDLSQLCDFDFTDSLMNYDGLRMIKFDGNIYDSDTTSAVGEQNYFFCNISKVEKVGRNQYAISWGCSKTSLSEPEIVTINSPYDIWMALGGINSYRRSEHGYERCDKSMRFTMMALGDADEQLPKFKGKKVDVFKSSMIHTMPTREAVKYSQSNMNSRSVYQNEGDVKVNMTTTSFTDAGKQGNFAHVSDDDDEVALMTQIIYSCAGFGDMSEASAELQESLMLKMNQTVSKYQKLLIGQATKDKDGNDMFVPSQDEIKRFVVTEMAKYLKSNSKGRAAGAGDAQIAMVNAFEKLGKNMDIDGISFVRSGDFHNVIIDMASMINKACVRIKLNGHQNVLLPSDGMIRVHGGRFRGDYGYDEDDIYDLLDSVSENAKGKNDINDIQEGSNVCVVDKNGKIVDYIANISEGDKKSIANSKEDGESYYTDIECLGEVEVDVDDIVPGLFYTIEDDATGISEVLITESNIDTIKKSHNDSKRYFINRNKPNIVHFEPSELYIGERYFIVRKDGTTEQGVIRDYDELENIKSRHEAGVRYVEDVYAGRDLRCDMYRFSDKSDPRRHKFNTFDLYSVKLAFDFWQKSGSPDAIMQYLKTRDDIADEILSRDSFTTDDDYKEYLNKCMRRAINNDLSSIKNGHDVEIYDFVKGEKATVTPSSYKYFPAECSINSRYREIYTVDDETGEEVVFYPADVFGMKEADDSRAAENLKGKQFYDASLCNHTGRTYLLATQKTFDEFLNGNNHADKWKFSETFEFENDNDNIRYTIGKMDKTFTVGNNTTNYAMTIVNSVGRKVIYPLFITQDVNTFDFSDVYSLHTSEQNKQAFGFAQDTIRNNVKKVISDMKTTKEAIRYVFCSRTPSQGKNSGMPMRIAVYHDDPYNNVYVSKLQLLLHGSDFDIDKISQLLFNMKHNVFIHWSKFAKVNTGRNYANSMRLPMPDESLSTLVAESMVISEDRSTNVISHTSHIDDINTFFDGIDTSKPAVELLNEMNGERIGLFSKICRDIKHNKYTIPYKDGDTEYKDKAVKFCEMLIEYNKPENANEDGLNNFTLNKLIEIFSDPDSYQEINNPLDSMHVLKDIKDRNSKDRDSSLVSTGVIGSEICRTFDTQTGKDTVGIGANGNKALYATMTSALYAASTKDPKEIQKMIFDKKFKVRDKNGDVKEITCSNIIGSPASLLTPDMFVDASTGTNHLKSIFDEDLANKIQDIYDDCRGRLGNRIDYMYALMCHRSKLDANSKTAFDKQLGRLFEKLYGTEADKMLLKDIQSSLLNAIRNQGSAYWNSFDNQKVVSEFISAAVDNAKEGILNVLNAGTNMMNMYVYGLAIGIDIESLNRIMTSDIALEIASIANGDMYNREERRSTKMIIKDIENGPRFSWVIKDAVMKALRETKSGISKDSTTDDDSKLIMKYLYSGKSCIFNNPKQSEKFITELNAQLPSLQKNTTSRNQVIDYINSIRRYTRFRTITKMDPDMWDNIVILNQGASEMKLLTDLLRPAMGINVLPEDNDSYFVKFNLMFRDASTKSNGKNLRDDIKELNEDFNKSHPGYLDMDDEIDHDVHLEFIALDESYLDGLVNIYDKYMRDTFNIFYILKTNKNYLEAIKAQCMHRLVLMHITDNKFNAVQYLKKRAKISFGYYLDEKMADKHINRMLEHTYVNEFLQKCPNIIIPKGTSLIRGSRSEGHENHVLLGDMPITLGTGYGNSFCKDFVDNTFFANIVSNGMFYGENGANIETTLGRYIAIKQHNTFIRDISIPKYAPNFDVTNESSSDYYDFVAEYERIANMKTSIKTQDGRNLSVAEVITMYDYIVNAADGNIESFTKPIAKINNNNVPNVFSKTYMNNIVDIVRNFNYKDYAFRELLFEQLAPVYTNKAQAKAFNKKCFWLYDSAVGDYFFYENKDKSVDAIQNQKPKVSEDEESYEEDYQDEVDYEEFYEEFDDLDYGDQEDYGIYDDSYGDEEGGELPMNIPGFEKYKYSFSLFSPFGFHNSYITSDDNNIMYMDKGTGMMFRFSKNGELSSIVYNGKKLYDKKDESISFVNDNGDKVKINISDDIKAVRYLTDGSEISNFANIANEIKSAIEQENANLKCSL